MTPQLPNEVIDEMTKRHHRFHHFLWHEVRNNWLNYDIATKNELTNLGWEPPRPALSESNSATGTKHQYVIIIPERIFLYRLKVNSERT